MAHENFGKCLDVRYSMRKLSPDDGYHYFFGYYDINTYHENGKYHLANRVKFMDRLPTKDDVCELGYIDLETLKFHKFAETTAWNFQQGALLTYNKANYDEVFYNVRKGDSEFSTCRHNLKTGEKFYTDRACANISMDGKLGVAINFSRIYDFRPGYGYSDVKDPWADVNAPEDDGVYIVDMQTGKSKFIISLARMLKEFPNEVFPNGKFLINHITFNPSANRFLMLLRNFAKEGSAANGGWKTSLYTSDLEGNMYELIHNGFVSHYHWKNDEEVMFYCQKGNIRSTHVLRDLTQDYTTYAEPIWTYDVTKTGDFHNDIHCLYSPDMKYFIGDGYPQDDHCRHLYLYNLETGKTELLFRDYSVIPDIEDIRCDLHNRWNTTSDKFSFDSTRNGKREIYEVDLTKPVK